MKPDEQAEARIARPTAPAITTITDRRMGMGRPLPRSMHHYHKRSSEGNPVERLSCWDGPGPAGRVRHTPTVTSVRVAGGTWAGPDQVAQPVLRGPGPPGGGVRLRPRGRRWDGRHPRVRPEPSRRRRGGHRDPG